MRFLLVLALLVVASCHAAPQRSKLQFGNNDADNKPFIEEVVVESVLQVRNPSAGRQARTNTQTNLRDGARVSEMTDKDMKRN